MTARHRRTPRRRRLWWVDLPKQELLDVRLCDLDLRIEKSVLAARIERLQADLERAGLRFRPAVWLSTDWFSPSGVPGFAIPFYLAHPRLARLEHGQGLEVEGRGETACMKLLRHETGHAIDNAYRLHLRRGWRDRFGSPALPYRQTYAPRPSSRQHVLHLDNWYSQSHPLEDWAETFAVWLAPRSRWRSAYVGWPALEKLEYVDAVMREIADRPPLVRSRERTDSLPQLRQSLREYYRRKRVRYGVEDRSGYDRDLLRLFGTRPGSRARPTAAAFLRRHRAELTRKVSFWTDQPSFVVEQVVTALALRAKELRLRLERGERQTLEGVAIVVAQQVQRLVRRRQQEYQR